MKATIMMGENKKYMNFRYMQSMMCSNENIREESQ